MSNMRLIFKKIKVLDCFKPIFPCFIKGAFRAGFIFYSVRKIAVFLFSYSVKNRVFEGPARGREQGRDTRAQTYLNAVTKTSSSAAATMPMPARTSVSSRWPTMR